MKVHINSLRKYSISVDSGNGSLRKSHSVRFFIKYKGRRKLRSRADCAEYDLTITFHCVGKALAPGRRRDSIVHASPCSYVESDRNTRQQILYTLVQKSPRGIQRFLFWWKGVIWKRNLQSNFCSLHVSATNIPSSTHKFGENILSCHHQMWVHICVILVLHSFRFEDYSVLGHDFSSICNYTDVCEQRVASNFRGVQE